MDFILSKIISRPRSAPDPKGCDQKKSGNGVESSQKSREQELIAGIPVKESPTVDEGKTSGNFIDNSHPENINWREVEKGGCENGFEDLHGGGGGNIANCSALSSDDETFVECHSFIGDQTIDNPPALNSTAVLPENPAEESLSSTFDSGRESSKSPGKIDLNLIASDFVEEIVLRALENIPEQKIDKSVKVDESLEKSVIEVADSTIIIDKEDKNCSLDDEILKLTENLARISIPEKTEEIVQSSNHLNETFEVADVSMRDVENLPVNSTVDQVKEEIQEDRVVQEIAESTVIIEKKEEKMPETIENNLSRNESFDESLTRDSPKTPSVSSSFNSLNNQPDSASQSNTFVENLITENVDFAFKVPEMPGDGVHKKKLFGKTQENPPENTFTENDFQPGSEFEFTQSDLDYLLTRGGDKPRAPIDRNSLLLRFDPLLNQPIPATPQLKASFSRQQQKAPIQEEAEEEEEEATETETPNLEDTVAPCMSENDDLGCVNTADNSLTATSCEYAKDLNSESDSYKDCLSQASSDATMSVDVIKEVSEVNINCEETFKKDYKMAELEKKVRNEVLKTEDIEKKLKEAEAREEALLKRITENQKTITKMTGVLEAYEKTIAELIAEKQQIIESYEKKCADMQNERDLNFQHLTSLEGTFTDLHAKYERSKQITTSLKKSEESLIAEKKQCYENLRLQEQRYEKMKSHAMQQLELANSKLDVLTKTHAQEAAKLKALLKKEEISRLSTNEQLIQKTRENEELVKICDELINGSAPTS